MIDKKDFSGRMMWFRGEKYLIKRKINNKLLGRFPKKDRILIRSFL